MPPLQAGRGPCGLAEDSEYAGQHGRMCRPDQASHIGWLGSGDNRMACCLFVSVPLPSLEHSSHVLSDMHCAERRRAPALCITHLELAAQDSRPLIPCGLNTLDAL